MKKLASLLLAVLMLLPAFACFAFANGNSLDIEPNDVQAPHEGENIISEATLSSFAWKITELSVI